jgi:hypothetical protein
MYEYSTSTSMSTSTSTSTVLLSGIGIQNYKYQIPRYDVSPTPISPLAGRLYLAPCWGRVRYLPPISPLLEGGSPPLLLGARVFGFQDDYRVEHTKYGNQLLVTWAEFFQVNPNYHTIDNKTLQPLRLFNHCHNWTRNPTFVKNVNLRT